MPDLQKAIWSYREFQTRSSDFPVPPLRYLHRRFARRAVPSHDGRKLHVGACLTIGAEFVAILLIDSHGTIPFWLFALNALEARRCLIGRKILLHG